MMWNTCSCSSFGIAAQENFPINNLFQFNRKTFISKPDHFLKEGYYDDENKKNAMKNKISKFKLRNFAKLFKKFNWNELHFICSNHNKDKSFKSQALDLKYIHTRRQTPTHTHTHLGMKTEMYLRLSVLYIVWLNK